MENLEAVLQRIEANTAVIAQLLAVSLPRGFVSRLYSVLDSDVKRQVYILSTGARSAREVARLAETSHPTVGRWWADWLERGLVEDPGDGRMKASFNLALIGLADRLEGSEK